jgi:acyl-CoA thioester hydrolase
VAAAKEETSAEVRAAYPHFLSIPTRWLDNDVYGHVNNVQYYAFFDTVINRWLIEEGGLDIQRGPNAVSRRQLRFPRA